MSLADDLLTQATMLANLEQQGAPRQASLRRAVSSAYYALFHLLTNSASTVFAPAQPAALRHRVQRTLEHGSMKEACERVLHAQPRPLYRVALPSLVVHSPELTRVARAFVSLQEARHTADYDTARKHVRSQVLQLIAQVKLAFAAWSQIADTEEASVFLADLIFGKRLTR